MPEIMGTGGFFAFSGIRVNRTIVKTAAIPDISLLFLVLYLINYRVPCNENSGYAPICPGNNGRSASDGGLW